jgi:OOP family OmpA-OmpF porin
MRGLLSLVIALFLPAPAMAVELLMPGNAEMTREVVTEADSYLLPVGPFADGEIPTREVTGRVIRQAWRIEAQGMTTLQILGPLRRQIENAGFDVIYDCAGQACGGFDFRFNTDVLAAPDMFVDLSDYRYLAARRDTDTQAHDYLSVLVSRAGATGYAQVVHVSAGAAGQAGGAAAPRDEAVYARADSLAGALMREGHVVLRDLVFESGSSTLGAGPYDSLRGLAAFLKADSTRRIALVGHTDTVGGLEANVDLSRQRATSVLDRLVMRHGVAGDQLEAGGMGYLSPIATNRTAAGRDANRRVEAVFLSTD